MLENILRVTDKNFLSIFPPPEVNKSSGILNFQSQDKLNPVELFIPPKIFHQ